MAQRGESPSKSKTSAFIQRGESPDKAKIGAIRHDDHDHDVVPLVVRHRKRKGNRLPQRFVSLHHHSTFSYLDGFQLPEAHVRRVEELNMSALALTEHGNMASHVKLEVAASKTGVKPIFGVEMYCGEIDEERRSQLKNHLTLLASDQRGYRNLLELVSRSYSEGFYYEATADGRMLADHSEGVICLSGCQGSLLFTSLMGGKGIDPADASPRRAQAVARRFKGAFGDRYFIEVQAFPELEATCQANPVLAGIAERLNIPLVATMDVHYTDVSEREMQKILHNVRGGGRQSLEEQARAWGYKAALAPPQSDMAIYRRLVRTGITPAQARQAILNTEAIAQQCNVTLPKLPQIQFPTDHPRGAFGEWEDRIEEGWRFRGFDRLDGRERRDAVRQLKKERKVIEAKGFLDYFLVVADAVRWAKDQQIAVGPARGSAAASLICYLLRITEVNPQLFPNLVFERFIDTTREDLPDIDLDFDSERRGEVRDYLVSRYGSECVNNIGTFSTYKAKLALDDVARVFHIPKYDVTVVKELLLERSSGDLRSSATIEDTVEYFENARHVFDEHPDLRKAMELEGNVKGFGIHAAGLVVSNGPITSVASVVERIVGGERRTVVAMDKYDAERQGLLKLDFLGLSTVTALAEACRQVGMSVPDMYEISLTDPAVINGFRTNDVVGIFQFDGRATRSINGALMPDSFNEVCDVNALSRPGPLHNGASNDYIDIKRGNKQAETMHPLLEDITKHTKYQVIYQEQILRIVREIGQFSWTHAAYIRKIISRKIGDAEFNRQWETFQKGAIAQGVTPEDAQKIWGLCITAGSYAFNYAHCVAYGMLAWWMMWFKIHHPAAFYAACLQKMPDKPLAPGVKIGSHVSLMQDARRHNIEIKPPHLRRSGRTWRAVNDRKLRAGYEQIPGIGEKMADEILAERDRMRFTSWASLERVKGIGPKTIIKIRDFCEDEDPFQLDKLRRAISTTSKDLARLGLPIPTHTGDEIPYEKGEETNITWLGTVIHRNLRDLFEINRAKTGEELDEASVYHPELHEFVIMAGYDGGELVSIRVNRFRYPQLKKSIWNMRPGEDLVLVQGTKPSWRHAREIQVDKMWVIDPEDD